MSLRDIFNETDLPDEAAPPLGVMDCVAWNVDLFYMTDCSWVNGFFAGLLIALVFLSLLFCIMCCCCFPCKTRRHHFKDNGTCVRSYSMTNVTTESPPSISAPMRGGTQLEPPAYINGFSIPRVSIKTNKPHFDPFASHFLDKSDTNERGATEPRLSTFSTENGANQTSSCVLNLPIGQNTNTESHNFIKNGVRRLKREKEFGGSGDGAKERRLSCDPTGPLTHMSTRSWRGYVHSPLPQPYSPITAATYSSAQNFSVYPFSYTEDDTVKKSQSARNVAVEVPVEDEPKPEDNEDDYCDADVPLDEVVFRRKFDARPHYRRYRV